MTCLGEYLTSAVFGPIASSPRACNCERGRLVEAMRNILNFAVWALPASSLFPSMAAGRHPGDPVGAGASERHDLVESGRSAFGN
jgi:hypothetical protein